MNEPFNLTGNLTSRGVAMANAPVTVTRSDGNGAASLGTIHTGSTGSYLLRVTPPNGEYVTYTVSYAGDDAHRPTKASHKLWVDRLATFLSISTDYNAYWYHHTAKITVHLGTTYRSRWVTVHANEAGLGKSKIASGYVNADGKLFTAYRMRRNTTFSAEFKGDLRRAPATASHYVHTAVIPTLTLKGYYGTDKYGRRLYHKSQWIHQRAHVDPNKAGQCVYFDVQYKKDGTWHDMGFTPCFPLGPGSNSDAWFNTPDNGVVGRVYRFGFYWKSDAYNLGVGSLWAYAKVTA